MEDNRKQYVLEMQQRYYKFLQQEEANEQNVRDRNMPPEVKKRQKRGTRSAVPRPRTQPAVRESKKSRQGRPLPQ